jgi:hypothetical protein
MRYDGSAWKCIQATQWLTYTPTWRITGGTALSMGNGTLSGFYRHIGETVDVRIELLRGSTTNVGTTTYTWDLPVAAATFAQAVGVATIYQASGPVTGYYIMMPNSTTLALNSTAGNSRVSNSTFTWADGDRILIAGSYRAGTIG